VSRNSQEINMRESLSHFFVVASLLPAATLGAACGSSSSSSREAPLALPPARDAGGADDAGSGEDADGAADDAAARPRPVPVMVPSDPQGVQAVKASDFLASLGVNAHVGQGVDDPTKSATAMAFVGIRSLRDGGSASKVKDWIAMHQSAGIVLTLLTSSDVPGTIDMAKQLKAAGALLAVEGYNEPNNFPVTYDGVKTSMTTTFLPDAKLQRDLYAAVKAEPTLAGIPVFHSSEAGGAEPDNVGLQFLTIPEDAGVGMPGGTKYADYANVHNYVCGHASQLVDNVAWNASDPSLNGDWDGLYVEYGKTWNKHYTGYATPDLVRLPRVSTETGWKTMGDGAITLEQQGRVFLNLVLAAFTRNFSYTFIYMLRDDPIQGYWGLFDTNYQPKTSGLYMHNLTTILADTGASIPGKLGYTIADQPATVHDLLMQKSTGAFELVVWDERPMGGSDVITVDLGMPRAHVTLYDPTTGTAPTGTMDGVRSVSLTLGDHPVIVQIE
jgi:hypothetical protein